MDIGEFKSTRKAGQESSHGLEVIEGGRFKGRSLPRLSKTVRESYANRFLYNEARLSTLAWESGLTLSQHDIACVAVEIARAEAFENGRRAERACQRLMPSMGVAA